MSWDLVERDREWRAFEVAGGHSLNICDFPKMEGTGQSMERSGGELLLGMLMPHSLGPGWKPKGSTQSTQYG